MKLKTEWEIQLTFPSQVPELLSIFLFEFFLHYFYLQDNLSIHTELLPNKSILFEWGNSWKYFPILGLKPAYGVKRINMTSLLQYYPIAPLFPVLYSSVLFSILLLFKIPLADRELLPIFPTSIMHTTSILKLGNRQHLQMMPLNNEGNLVIRKRKLWVLN